MDGSEASCGMLSNSAYFSKCQLFVYAEVQFSTWVSRCEIIAVVVFGDGSSLSFAVLLNEMLKIANSAKSKSKGQVVSSLDGDPKAKTPGPFRFL